MSNRPVTDLILQAASGFYRRKLMAGTVLTLTADKVTITDAGGTFTFPRADYVPPAPPPIITPPPVDVPTPQASGMAPKLSGIRVTQAYPIGANARFYQTVGFLDPIGGIGKGVFQVKDSRGGLYRLANGDELATSDGIPMGPDPDVIHITYTDGRGDTVSIDYSVRKTAGAGVAMNSRNPMPNVVPIIRGNRRADVYPSGSLHAWGADPTIDDRGYSFKTTNQDGSVSSLWSASDLNAKMPPPSGSYPLRVTPTYTKVTPPVVGTPLDLTITLADPAPITEWEFHPSGALLTTETLVGTVIGRVLVNTPMQMRFADLQTLTLTDLTGTLAIDPSSGDVSVVKKPTLGPISFHVAVSALGGAITGATDFTVQAVQGYALPPARMSFAQNKLDNSMVAPKVGQLKVEGVSGGRWVITKQSGFNPYATTGVYGIPARYQIDNTGLVFCPPECLLSYQDPACNWETDQLTAVWTSDDGLTVCQNTFQVHVDDCPNVSTIFVGKGMKARYGANGLDTIHEMFVKTRSFHPGLKYWFKVQPDADPNAYMDGSRGEDTKNGVYGPTWIELLPGTRLGGRADNTGADATGAGSGITSYGKGHLIIGPGDFRLIGGGGMISGVHGNTTSDGKEGIRKDGNTYGNWALFDLLVQDCDQGIEAGVNHGYGYCERVQVRRCGGSAVSAGLTHGFYIGTISKFEMVDSYVDETPWGHLVKSRARETILRRNKLIDTGAAACCIDLSNGGKALLEDNCIRKGPFAANPSAINFAAEGVNWAENTLTLNRNVIVAGGISYGGNYGPIAAVTNYHAAVSTPTTVNGSDNQVWLPPMGQLVSDNTGNGSAGASALANTTLLTVPPVLGALPPLSGKPHRRKSILDSVQAFRNFNGVPQSSTNGEWRVTAPGPLDIVLTAMTDIVTGGEPFGAGTKWSVVQDAVYNGRSNPAPWAKDGTFGATTNADGTAIPVYLGGLPPGGYFVQIRATGPSGTLSDGRYLVTVT